MSANAKPKAVPGADAARLEALAAYRITGTAPEAEYDDIARLAARACGTAAAFITFIDADRQFFKAAHGAEGVRESVLDSGFCPVTVALGEALVIPDARADGRYSGNPAVLREPFLRFYAGVPLRSRDGHALGALCVVDPEPREPGEGQLDALRALARQVEALLALRLLVSEQARLLEEQERARRALEASEERLRLSLASGHLGTWDADLRTGVLTLSEEIGPMYGLPREPLAVAFDEWFGFLHPDDRPKVAAAFQSALDGGPDYATEFRVVWPDRETVRWIDTRGLIQRDPSSGAPVRAVGFTRDATEEKRHEEEREALLSRQRVFLRDLVRSLTEDKVQLCLSGADLPEPLSPSAEPVSLSAPTLRDLRRAINAATARLGFEPERAHDLVTAAGEAAMNAVTHGGGGEGRVCADEARGVVQVWVRDSGGGISEDALPKVLQKGVSTAGTLGHGFWLILRSADRCYLLTGSGGTTVVLEQGRTAPEPVWLTASDWPG